MSNILPFANRAREVQIFQRFCSGSERILLYRSKPGIGTSRLLEHLSEISSPNAITVSGDFLTDDLAAFRDRLTDERNTRLLDRICMLLDERRILKPLLKIFGALSHDAQRPQLTDFAIETVGFLGESIILSPFPSDTIAIIQRRLRSRPRRSIYLLLDNVQRREAEVIALLKACEASEHYGHVRFVLAYVESREGDANDFIVHLPFRSEAVALARIGEVDDEFVRSIADAAQIDLDRNEARSLIDQARGRIKQIIDILMPNSRARDLDPASVFILRLLFVAEQGLRRSDLSTIARESAELTGEQIDAIESRVRYLEAERIVSVFRMDDGDLMVSLSSSTSDAVERACGNDLELLVPRELVYRYFSRLPGISTRHSDSSRAALLYRLARVLDEPAIPRLAQELVRVAMGSGSLFEAEQYIKAAIAQGASPSLHDRFVQIAFYVSVQDYNMGKSLLDQIPRVVFGRYRILRILDAVCLNRMRQHDESGARLAALLEDAPTKQEANLLVAYRISGLLHQERFLEARAMFEHWEPILRRSSKNAFFLRNGAAVYMLGPNPEYMKATQYLRIAETSFKKAEDAFGLATTKCNLGVAMAYLGDSAQAHRLFTDSFERLNILGTQHIQESGTNLGTILMALGKREEARAHLERMLSFMELDFPRVVAECNVAVLDAHRGAMKEAVARAEKLVDNVESLDIIDARRRARLTCAVVHAANGDRMRASEMLSAVLELGNGDATSAAVSALAAGEFGSDALQRYPHEYMQYWSLNPLMMVPSSALTEQTVLNDVA